MNLQIVGGLILMLLGSILFSGEKSLGIHNPPMGVLLIGGGFMFCLYGYLNDSVDDAGGPRRRAKDNMV